VQFDRKSARKTAPGQLIHVSHIVALRQPSVAKLPKRLPGLPKELAPTADLRFNLKKVAYMLVAAFKTDNGG
jgi:hypothetical protein